MTLVMMSDTLGFNIYVFCYYILYRSVSCDLMRDHHKVKSAMFAIIEVRCHQHNYKIFLCFRDINYRDSNCNHPF
jgi:hypothetical protein